MKKKMGVALPHPHPPREGCKEEVLAGGNCLEQEWAGSGAGCRTPIPGCSAAEEGASVH